MNLDRLPPWSYLLIAILPALAVAGIAAIAKPGLQASTAVVLAFVVWGIVFGGLAWRRMDETSREAQKSASMWGSSFGRVFLLVVCAIAMTWPGLGDPMHRMIEQISANAAHRGELWTFTLGALAAGVVQTVGFVIVWAGWWLSKRR